ncbi:hypothetical protein RND81_03G075400 [Saponaria officinalis]
MCSCIAVSRHDRVEIIPNDHCNRTTPSYVSFTDYDRLIGETAVNQATTNHLNTIFDVKRLIGRQYDSNLQRDTILRPFTVVDGTESGRQNQPMILVKYVGEEKKLTPEEISAMTLAKLKSAAEEYLGSPVNNAVISVPALFNNSQRQATKDAGIIAGFKGIRLINDPTAAAMAYDLDMKINGRNGGNKNVLVFDLGGGTFDVSLLAIEKGRIEVKAVSGDTQLGGANFDNRMVREFVTEFEQQHNKDISNNARALVRLRLASEKAKRVLSLLPQADVEIERLFEDFDFSYTITRARFEELNKDLFEKCLEKVDECLTLAGMEKNDVVLVGGSSRIPMVQQMVRTFFNGKELCKTIHPDEAVASGAAIHAAKLSSAGDIVVAGRTPLSISIYHDDGSMFNVISRNTTFPTKKIVLYKPNIGSQTSDRINVCEDEETNPKKYNLLGLLEFSVFPLAPTCTTQIQLCFDVDVDGILNASAMQVTTMNRHGQLTEEDIKRLIKEAENYKAQDEEREKLLQAKSALEGYANTISDQLIEGEKMKLNVDKKRIKKAIDSAFQLLGSSSDVLETSAFEKKLKELQSICGDFNLHLQEQRRRQRGAGRGGRPSNHEKFGNF